MTVIQFSSRSRRNKEAKQHCEEAKEAYSEDKRRKLDRTRYRGAGDDVKLANIFSQLGMASEFGKDKQQAFQDLAKRVEGRELRLIPKEALEFLKEDFNVTVEDDRLGRQFIHFPKGEIVEMSLLTDVAQRSGQTRTVVREIYAALLKSVRIALRRERRAKLPDLCIIRVAYRPAKEKRKGMNPFTGKKQWFKAKPASNKLGFRPAKKLKVFVDRKVAVEAPPKKKKKEE